MAFEKFYFQAWKQALWFFKFLTFVQSGSADFCGFLTITISDYKI